MRLTLGIDIACRAAHRASLADERGEFLWVAKAFRTMQADLEGLWAAIPDGAGVTVIMEPTRNAWVPLAAWSGGKVPGSCSCRPSVRPTCVPTTPSTPRATSSTRGSWHACRCSIPRASIKSAASVRVTRCGVRRSCTRPSCAGAARHSRDSMRSSRSWGPASTPRSAVTSRP